MINDTKDRGARRLNSRGIGAAMAAALASALMLAVLVLPAGVANAITVTTAAGFFSQTGEFLGQGQAYAFTTVTVDSANTNGVDLAVSNASNSFNIELSAATGGMLTAGTTYANAQRFEGADNPGIDIFGDGRGCNTDTGSFTVHDVTFVSTTLTSFAAQFTEHCEGGAAALFGYVSYQSAATLPTWVVPSMSSLAYGSARVGDSPGPQSMELANLGSPTTVTGFGLSGAGEDDYLGQTDCDGVTLTLGQACGVELLFLPGEPGPRPATLVPQGVPSPPTIALTGSGTVGYYQADSAGDVFPYGDAGFYGSMGGKALNSPMVSLAVTPDGFGYWLLGADGGVFSFGDAAFFGSTGNIRLNEPVVSMTPTNDGGGYWFVARDGGIFAFGDAKFHGSMGGKPLNAPIVGMAAAPDGNGYWLIASDGGMFAFGDAKFYGSMGGKPLNSPIVGMAPTPDGKGYWLIASDGGMFSFGDAHFYGSMGGKALNSPIVGMAPTWDGRGYWLTAYDGGVFCFGDAPFFGSPVGPGSAGGIAIEGTAPFTVQATLDLPGVRHAPHLAPRPGWRPIGKASP